MANRHAPRLRPLCDWDDDHSAPAEVLWWSRLDERYQVEAHGLPARRVRLVAFDHANDDQIVGCAVVRMIGEPRYGPDPDDVYAWQIILESWVDGPPVGRGRASS